MNFDLNYLLNDALLHKRIFESRFSIFFFSLFYFKLLQGFDVRALVWANFTNSIFRSNFSYKCLYKFVLFDYLCFFNDLCFLKTFTFISIQRFFPKHKEKRKIKAKRAKIMSVLKSHLQIDLSITSLDYFPKISFEILTFIPIHTH